LISQEKGGTAMARLADKVAIATGGSRGIGSATVCEAGLRVLDYLHQLKEVSPPDILEMDWDRRTISFLSGQTALAYCWTVRAARFENDITSTVKRKVSPGGLGAFRTTPSAASSSAFHRTFRQTGSNAPSRRSPG